MPTNFDLTPTRRQELIQFVQKRLENFYAHTADFNISPKINPTEIIDFVRQFDLKKPPSPEAALEAVMNGLEQYQVHITHPKYFGLFNPRANFASILADWISATYNPQMAAWSHAPYAAEVENYLVQEIGQKFGYSAENCDGTFCSGGAEANMTAVICAVNRHFPDFVEKGWIGIQKRPLIYCSAEAHHSVDKAAKCVGLGTNSVIHIPVDADFKIDTAVLTRQLAMDLQAGHHPFMIVGTAGTTGLGAIDQLDLLASIAQKYNLWFHVDAAYGGAVTLHPEYKQWIIGIEKSDSITFDVHKWLSVPMAASLLLTPHKDILHLAFRINNNYMPTDSGVHQIVDPYEHSIQWSRRFIGLKLYLSLLFFGWEGYIQMIEHQVNMGQLLTKKLQESGWLIQSKSNLPIICFTHPDQLDNANFALSMYGKIVQSGQAWLSVYPVNGQPTIRACVTNYATTETDIIALVNLLNELSNN